ncbi:unnamed protein product [Phytophthora lilii]|uniref:Unnamed protein product n=1 Tax=Phytophthora lilii TaxID=2077276 RepID=A0A9W6TBT6_9STRA|nr:unnamed protein product [Phytophthora lilii]
MNEPPQLPEHEEAQDLLKDVLAFIDEFQDQNSPTEAAGSFSGDRAKKKCTRSYSPAYDRQRRERKKEERQKLRSQVDQYEAQLEILRLRKPMPRADNTKWGWLTAVTDEEEKRRKAEEINRQLRTLLAQQLTDFEKRTRPGTCVC